MDFGSPQLDFKVQFQERLQNGAGKALLYSTLDMALFSQAKKAIYSLSYVGRRAYDDSWDRKIYDYEAISYTWGRSTEKAAVRINGRRMEVPKNVRDMLLALRLRWQPRYLWINYICVNQADNDEKIHQIQMMRRVYHYASNVLVWLGDAPDAKDTVCLLTEIARLVVQEAAVARNLQILYGDQYIDWRDLLAVIALFMRPETLGLIRRRENADIGVDDIIRLNNATLLFQVKMQVSAGVSRSLAGYLHALRSFVVTDGRDKVFALLGLVENSHHPLILPRYKKDGGGGFH
ncbi:heterokaryon incompatibility protein-domain-containing protein [Podospora didyma]|uniref:Heterokaryon incompatibility protein-domain-containing protein n=1 Tax=Podospora didyma TaxID=330526 RepID=A0AAE0K1F7_9PEZI|nr:heterokaryon incompatibility protein-domain-containing protein [Podospora didyma]